MKANYLASPPLVVAYALAGTTDIDLTKEPVGTGKDGKPVMLADIWPTHAEVQSAVESSVLPEMFQDQYDNVWAEKSQVERHRSHRRRAVRVGRGEHLHPGAAVPGRSQARGRADQADPGSPLSGTAGRFGDDRSHFARWIDCRRTVPPANSCRPPVWSRATSTATVPAAATTA